MGSCITSMCGESCGECCGMIFGWFGCDCAGHEDRKPDVKTEGRGCTDVVWLFVFAAMWLASISIMQTRSSDVLTLLHGTDYKGRMCGFNTMKEKKYSYYPLFTDNTMGSVAQFQDDANSKSRFVMCAESCNNTMIAENMAGGFTYETKAMGYFCVVAPDAATAALNTTTGGATEAGTAEYIADMEKSQMFIVFSMVFALFMSVMFMMCMRFLLRPIVYFALIASVGASFWAAADFYTAWDLCKKNGDGGCDKVQAFFIATLLVGLLLAAIVYNMWASISIGITIIEMATKAVGDMPYTLLTPFPMIMLTWGFMAYWVYYALVLYSDAETFDVTGTPFTGVMAKPEAITEVVTGYKVLAFNYAVQQNTMWFHLFFGLWNTQFLNYFTYTMLAGAFADWYFSDWDPDHSYKLREEEADQDHRLSPYPVLSSTWRALRFHTGTILLASLIVAIVDFIRCVVYYIKRNLHESLTYVAACIDCCLWCIRCCLDIISKNCLIYCSIWGTPFCASASNAFWLMLENASVAFAVNGITWIIMFIGKFIVAAFVTLFCHHILKSPYAEKAIEGELSSEKFVLMVVFVVSYFMACMFLSVYEVAVDTIFMGYMVAPDRADDSLQEVCEANKLDEDDPTIQEYKKFHSGEQVSGLEDAHKIDGGNFQNNVERDDDIEAQGVKA